MRPLVCFIATSLDGYIAGPAGEIDWFFTEPGDQKQEPPRVTFSTAC
jgi:dihydrofolate reductase